VFQLKGPNFYQVMTALVEALRYKLDGRGFDYRWGHGNLHLLIPTRLSYV